MNDSIYPKGNGTRTLIIGLDAITWDIINPMIERGELPNLARLIREGSSGTLKSLNPMMSPVVWTSIATGKVPEKHGITDFYGKKGSLKTLPLWDILGRLGRRVGTLGWLIPAPYEIPDFCVPGWLATTTDTYPPELSFIKELERAGKGGATRPGDKEAQSPMAKGTPPSGITGTLSPAGKRGIAPLVRRALAGGLTYGTAFRAFKAMVNMRLRLRPPMDMMYEKILIKNAMHTEFFCHLYAKHRPDFAAVVLYATDQIPHHFWRYMDPAGFDAPEAMIQRYRGVVERTYRESDASVGRILAVTPDDVNIILVSDHGMCKADQDVSFVFRTEELMGLLNLARRENAHFQILKNNLHISVKGEPSERKRDEAEIMEKLGRITIEETGKRLLDVSYDEYGNIMAALGPRDIDVDNAILNIEGGRVPFSRVAVTEGLLSAKHHEDGVIILKGPAIKAGHRLAPTSILDVTPTALALMGYPSASDMDGAPIEDAMKTPSAMPPIDSYDALFGLAAPAGQAALNEDEDMLIKERLRELGYLD